MRRGHGLGIETKPGDFPPKGATWAPPRAQGDWRIPKYAVSSMLRRRRILTITTFCKNRSKVESFVQNVKFSTHLAALFGSIDVSWIVFLGLWLKLLSAVFLVCFVMLSDAMIWVLVHSHRQGWTSSSSSSCFQMLSDAFKHFTKQAMRRTHFTEQAMRRKHVHAIARHASIG